MMKKAIKVRIIGVFLLLLAGVVIMFLKQIGETIYAPGYSEKKWDKIEIGMTKDNVIQILGSPLDYNVGWGSFEGEEKWERLLWSRPKTHHGCFACMWFNQDKVARKQEWSN